MNIIRQCYRGNRHYDLIDCDILRQRLFLELDDRNTFSINLLLAVGGTGRRERVVITLTDEEFTALKSRLETLNTTQPFQLPLTNYSTSEQPCQET